MVQSSGRAKHGIGERRGRVHVGSADRRGKVMLIRERFVHTATAGKSGEAMADTGTKRARGLLLQAALFAVGVV